MGSTHDKNVDLPHSASPSKSTVTSGVSMSKSMALQQRLRAGRYMIVPARESAAITATRERSTAASWQEQKSGLSSAPSSIDHSIIE